MEDNNIVQHEGEFHLPSKDSIKSEATKFSIVAPITEDEFDDSLWNLATFMLFNTKWDPSNKVKIPKKLPVISDMPMICNTKKCHYASVCPTLKAMDPSNYHILEGTRCREEKYLGIQHFTTLVKDLNIEPGQAVDILDVANLVRLYIYRRRIDWDIAVEGMTIEAVNAIDHKTKKAFGEMKEHPLLKVANAIDKQIDSTKKSLIASRKDRLTMAAQFGGDKEQLKKLFTSQLFGEEPQSLEPPKEGDNNEFI